MSKHPTSFDFWYAVNNTEVVVQPRRHLETFGNTLIHYHLLSEPMDGVGQVRIRAGRLQALRPQILMPADYAATALEGFGAEAKRYIEWLREHEDTVRILRYGYTLKQEAFHEELVTDRMETVVERVKQDPAVRNDPFCAVLKGVDEPWDVCLVRLFWLMTVQSVPTNVRELAERRMFEMQDGIAVGVRQEIEKAFSAATLDAALVKPLGGLLQKHGVFEQYQDRFFALVNRRNAT